MHVLAFAFVCQWLEPAPAPAEVGQEVRVEVRAPSGEPLPGVRVELRQPDAPAVDLGSSDAEGVVRFRPPAAGDHELRAELPGPVLLLTPLHVLPERRRWIWFAVLGPAGLALLVWNVLGLRRRRDAAVQPGPTGPSRPAP